MTEVTGGMLIAITEARDACKGELDVIERIRKAMRATHDHWMETDDNNQFRSAIGAAILESAGEEKERLERSAAALRKASALLGALQAGVLVDWSAIEKDNAETDLIPVVKLWHEIKESSRRG